MPNPLSAITLLVLDFDGVLTDNTVYVAEDGREMVRCSRSDSLGIAMLQERGVPVHVISKERNPVVAVRCQKMRVPFSQGVDDKLTALRDLVESYSLTQSDVAYIGNDTNDVECMRWVSVAAAPSDAHPSALDAADMVLAKPGGLGAVRAFIDELLSVTEATSRDDREG